MNTAGALEAVERIVNRGGEPAEVVAAVLGALCERGITATVRGADASGVTGGASEPIVRDGKVVGVLVLDGGGAALARRVALLISPYVRASV